MPPNLPDVLSAGTPSSVSFMSLHFDILVLLVSRLDRTDLLSLMQVCRSLHSALVPQLLRLHPTIRRTKQLMSFCQFILMDAPMRFHYLQRLSLAISYVWSPRISEMLLEVFRHATHLEELGVLDCGFLEGDPQLLSAIAALTNIKTLCIRYPTKVARDLLMRMQSQITRVDVSFSKVARHRLDPVDLLSSCRDSMTTLCMSLPQFDHTDIQFPALTKLVLKCHQCLRSFPLVYAYPNLRDLTMTMCRGMCGHGGFDPEPVPRYEHEIERFRKNNILLRPLASWKFLEHVCGDVSSLYHLALDCHAQRVDLTDLMPTDLPKMAAIMDDFKPCILRLELRTDMFVGELLPALMQYVPTDLHGLCFVFEIGSIPGDLKLYLDPPLSVKSSITYLFIRMQWVYSTHQDKAAESIKNIDIESLARRAAQRNPSLRYICVEVEPCAVMAWQSDHGQSLSVIPGPLALQIMQEKGM